MVHKYLFGVDGHDRLTSYLNFESGLVEKDCFFTFIIFNEQYLTQRCHKWKFQYIFSNFELVMIFVNFGQTMVDRSSWIVYETFRLVQINMVFNLWSQCDVPSYHHVLYMMLKGILVDASQIMVPKIWVFAWIFWKF